jgi:hypothetical protein
MNKYLLGIALSVLPTVAMAQQQPQPLTEIVLKVTNDELTLISDALQEMPLKKALPLINKLREQIMAQQPKLAEPPKN